MTEIQKLLNIIDSAADDPTRRDEVVQLAFMLERSNTWNKNAPEYLKFLTGDQLNVHLSPTEQEDVVREILKRIDGGNARSSSLMWATGKATPDVIVRLVHEFVLHKYSQMNDELLYQSIIALQNGFATDDKTVLSKIKFADLKAMFEFLVHSQDERISELAQDNVRSLQYYKEKGYW
jgi:hypothetical protein